MKKWIEALKKDFWIVLLDIIAVNLAYFLAIIIRFFVNGQLRAVAARDYLPAFLRFAPFYTVIALIIFMAFRLYGGMWRYAGINDMNRIIGASICTSVVQVVGTCLFVKRMPITYYVIGALLQFVLVTAIRFGYRILLVEKKRISSRNIPTVPTMVIGAGETAKKVMKHMDDTPFRAAVVVDEKSAGRTLDGVKIVPDFETALPSVRAVFIADPNMSAEKRAEIREKCEAAGIECQDYTGYINNLGGRIPISSLLELTEGPVTLAVDGNEQQYPSGEEALRSLKERYDIRRIEGAKITLAKPSSSAYVGYDAWAQQHKEQTGEDVSFF